MPGSTAASPAINTGDNAAYTSANGPTTDLAGNAPSFPSGGSSTWAPTSSRPLQVALITTPPA